MIQLRAATIDDCWDLAENLRPRDRQELALGRSATPLDKIIAAWKGSAPCEAAVTSQGALVCMWGVQTYPGGLGSIWMLGTPALTSVPLAFLRGCRPVIHRAASGHSVLACAPWRKNTLHLRWLQWLGFQPHDTCHPLYLPHFLHV